MDLTNAAATARPPIGDLTVSNLRAEIARARRSGEAFGREMGWSKATTSRKLNGRTALTLADVEKAARILGLDVVALLTEPHRAAS